MHVGDLSAQRADLEASVEGIRSAIAKMNRTCRELITAGALCLLCAVPTSAAWAADPPSVLRWAGDPEGGAPFVEADPARPDVVSGFDVDIAALLAGGLHRTPRFVMAIFCRPLEPRFKKLCGQILSSGSCSALALN